MSGPSVVVDRAPDGWTHIGGPGMHLLIALDEDDERTLAASDAADGGDIDDVVEVLTAGGMRKAHHFVGVHWQPRTRIVAFGPVAAVVTLADGTEHDVRAPSAKVWTDLELSEHPERVVLRVLAEDERTAPVPPQTLAGVAVSPVPGPDAASPTTPVAASSSLPPNDDEPPAVDQPAGAGVRALEPSADEASAPAATAGVPTFGAITQSPSSGAGAPRSSSPSWGRSWARDVDSPSTPVVGRPSPSAPSTSSTSEGAAPQSDPLNGQASLPPVDEAIDEVADADRSAGAPGVTPSAGAGSAAVQDGSAEGATGADPSGVAASPETVDAQGDSGSERAAAPPSPAPAAKPALRSWEAVAPAVPVRATVAPAPPAETRGTDVAPGAPGAPARPVSAEPEPAPPRSADLVAPAGPALPVTTTVPGVPATPVVDDLPAGASRDFESTWAARPVIETESPQQRPSAPTESVTRAAAPGSTASSQAAAEPTDTEAADEEPSAVPPSYDYLFGHTTMADEHRKVLAQLGAPVDDEGGQEDDDASPLPTSETSDAPVTNAAPAPVVPPRPMPAAPEVAEGGLISSVPWATSRPAPSVPKPEPEQEVVSFAGRRTPPPAPSLLPPMNTPPPGTRAPEATPLISTGPPPASPSPAAPVVPPPAPSPARAPARSSGDPSFEVPISTPQLSTPPISPPISTPPATPPPAAPVAPYRPVTQPIPSGPAPTVDVGAVAEDDDETELTVDRSALLEARNAAQNQTFSGPSVLAVLCSAGHPTPPHSDRCRVCGTGIPPQEPFTMPRPPLGVLRLSTGDVVTLDRSVLLGRAPRPGDGLAAHDRPHVVKVPSPERDVSRNHVEVILEGWHVLIRDLGTTNGTTVTLPGEVAVRLRANDQQVLEPGSLVSMADEVSFTFEAAS